MKMVLLAATLAMLTAAPLAAYADKGAAQLNKSTLSRADASDSYFVAPLVQTSLVPALPHVPRFIGPYELHDGLLPNGLTPNPPTYG